MSEHISEHVTDHAHEHPVTPWTTYFKVYLLLMLFMAITIYAGLQDWGALNNIVAMAIAVTKGTLVVLFFMQVKYGTRLIWLWASLGFIWFILLFITLQDYISRHWIPI